MRLKEKNGTPISPLKSQRHKSISGKAPAKIQMIFERRNNKEKIRVAY